MRESSPNESAMNCELSIPAEIIPPATAHQFGILIERMMPSNLSAMPEGKLVTAIFKQAWNDATCHASARRFFTDLDGGMADWCKLTGLNAGQIKAAYMKHHRINQEAAQ